MSSQNFLLRQQELLRAIPQDAGRVLIVDQSHRAASDSNPGSEARPWRTIQHAAEVARPGDTVYVKAGTYDPFEVVWSGTKGAPIVFAAYPGDEHDAIIDGSGTSVRGAIEVRGESHVTIAGFRIQNAPVDGIFVEGSKAGARNIDILGNQVDTTGNSGIYAAGLVMGQTIGVDEYRLFDVRIEGNEVTNTNTPSGGNEAISVGGGLDGFVIRGNWVHHSDQYGIDAKFGARNGEIVGNLVHDIEKHGIYLDSNSRTIANIDIHHNTVFNSTNGIVLARESARDPKRPNIQNVDIHDNDVHSNAKYGVLLYKHVRDNQTGLFDDVEIRGNSIHGNGLDGVRLAGIGGFATDIVVADNALHRNGRDINNQIGASESNNRTGVDPRTLALGDGADAILAAPAGGPGDQVDPAPPVASPSAPRPAPEPEMPEDGPAGGAADAPAVMAINIGSRQGFTAADGTRFAADTTGAGRASGTGEAIAGTRDDALYRSEAWGPDGLSYDLELPDGAYVVELHFAEIWSGAFRDGARVFDVLLEGRRVIDDLDVFGEAGARSALVKAIPVTVEDGALSIDLVKGVQNPKLSALVVREASAAEPAERPGSFGSLTLWDAERDGEISAMGPRTVVHEAAVAGRDLSVVAAARPGVESVRMSLDGGEGRVENIAPYALFGDRGSDLRGGGWSASEGALHRIEAEHFSADGGRGARLAVDEIVLEVGGDVLEGKRGTADLFVLDVGAMGAVRIEGFGPGDRVSLVGAGSDPGADLDLRVVGGDTVIDFGDGHVLRIADQTFAEAADFLL